MPGDNAQGSGQPKPIKISENVILQRTDWMLKYLLKIHSKRCNAYRISCNIFATEKKDHANLKPE